MMWSISEFLSGARNRLSNHFHGTPYEQKLAALEKRQEELQKDGKNPDNDERCIKLEKEAEELRKQEQNASKPSFHRQ